MFDVIVVRDTIRVDSSVLHRDVYSNHATTDTLVKLLRRQIRLTYTGRVIENHGLVVVPSAITMVGEAALHPGDAAWYFDCEFHLIMYNPAKNDVIHGFIVSSFASELLITQGFFQDVYVLPDRLPQPHVFEDGLYHWQVGDNSPAFALQDVGRWRIDKVLYNAKTPARPFVFKQRAKFKLGADGKEPEELQNVRQAIQARDDQDVALTSNFDLVRPDVNDAAAANDHDDNDPKAKRDLVESERRLRMLENGSAKTMLKPDQAKVCGMYTAPMVIMVQAADSGLGMAAWW